MDMNINDTVSIEGVEIKQLLTHSDERGFFREILRVTDDIFDEGFGQWSYAERNTGTGEYHLHKYQTDWWYVPIGIMEVYLHDMRQDSLSYQKDTMLVLRGDMPEVLKIPPGVAHGFEVVACPIHLFYITSHIYNPKDEGRIPYDNPAVGYDWMRQEIT
jgi:dTDP-4-dehydrorhamnose 3,5-epimerase